MCIRRTEYLSRQTIVLHWLSKGWPTRKKWKTSSVRSWQGQEVLELRLRIPLQLLISLSNIRATVDHNGDCSTNKPFRYRDSQLHRVGTRYSQWNFSMKERVNQNRNPADPTGCNPARCSKANKSLDWVLVRGGDKKVARLEAGFRFPDSPVSGGKQYKKLRSLIVYLQNMPSC